MPPRALSRVLAAIAFVTVSLAGLSAGAEQLFKLNVTTFTMQSDNLKPQVDTPFHIIFSIHVKQNVTQLQNVVLPAFGQLEIDGDEQHFSSSPSGTDYREIVTVVAHRPGHIRIGAAYMDAVDGRDGKPKRFLSTTPENKDTIELDVTGAVATPAPIALDPTAERTFVGALSFIGGLFVVGLLAVLVLLRRRPQVEQTAAPVSSDHESVALPAISLAEVVAELRARPTRDTALRARTAIWASIDAPEGATLSDVLEHPAARDPRLRAILQAAERAAFTHNADLPDALTALTSALEGYV